MYWGHVFLLRFVLWGYLEFFIQLCISRSRLFYVAWQASFVSCYSVFRLADNIPWELYGISFCRRWSLCTEVIDVEDE